jgi:hypothetical protein
VPETVWSTVDRLIHDLGAIRAFVDEAEAVPETSEAPEVAAVRGAMDAATDAITHLFTDAEAAAVEAAWTAIARAQDAVLRARGLIAAARASQEAAGRMRQRNHEQALRVLEQREELMDRMDRVRHRQLSPVEDGSLDDAGPSWPAGPKEPSH